MADLIDVEFIGGGPADGRTARERRDDMYLGRASEITSGGKVWLYEAEFELDPQPCAFRFRSDECGYRGAETSCDLSFARCRALGNERRFGGFPGLPGGPGRWIYKLKRRCDPGEAAGA